MTWKTAAAALALVLASAAQAQDPTPLEITIANCIAPGFIPEGDPYEILDSLPEANCIRACKAAAKGCKDVVSTIDQCGVKFLKAVIKVGTEICRGLGGTSQQCRGVAAQVNPDIDWWRAQGKLERAACDVEVQTNCLSQCGAGSVAVSAAPSPGDDATGGNLTTVVEGSVGRPLVPIPEGEGQDGVVEGAVELLLVPNSQ